MKTAINMLLWSTLVKEEHVPLFGELKETGFDGIEVPIFDGDPDHYAMLGRELDALGMDRSASTGLAEEYNPISADPAVREAAQERMRWTLDCAAALGSKVLCGPIHSAYATFTGSGPTADEHAWCVESMHRFAELAAERGIMLGCEFLNRFECYMLTTAKDARELVRAVGHPSFKMLYDTHHAHIEEKSVKDAIEQSAAEIGHVHISENDRGTPGKGQVDWDDTFGSLKAIGYDGWLVIESFSRLDPEFAGAIRIWRDFFASPEEVYREGHAFMRAMW